MPVYNTEKYIGKAIESILNQKFENFELIIIDDCSDDLSKKICEKYKKIDSRIILKQTDKNLGVANARNEGLKWVKGKYLTFVDADDVIDCNIFKTVHQSIQQCQTDIIKYGCIEEYYDRKERYIGSKKVGIPDHVFMNQAEIRKYIIEMEKLPLFGYLWNTFYNMTLLRKYKFLFDINFKVNEDFMFNLDAFDKATSLTCLSVCGYHYAKRVENSLSTKRNVKYYDLHVIKINSLLKKYEEWELLTSEISQDIYWLYTRYIYSAISQRLLYESSKEANCKLKEIFQSELFSKFRKIKFVNRSIKVKILTYVLQHEYIFLILWECKTINYVKKKFRVLFSKVKK